MVYATGNIRGANGEHNKILLSHKNFTELGTFLQVKQNLVS